MEGGTSPHTIVQLARAADLARGAGREFRERRPQMKSLLLIWAGATLLYSVLLMEQRQIHFSLALTLSAFRFGVLALLSMPVWTVCQHLMARRAGRWQTMTVHLAMGVVVLLSWMSLYLPYSAWLYGQTLSERIASLPPLQYLEFVLTYTLMVSGIVASQLSRRLDAQLRREAELEALAHEAELRALKAQIRPHFLFNVLNSIYSLIGSRPEQARDMVDLVADLMRRTVDASEEQLVGVDWELQVVDRYLRIEKVRLGERLDVSIVKESVPADAQVAPLILQPLVENAIKHGIAARPGPGRVEVYATGAGRRLQFIVRDTGPGIPGAYLRDVPAHGLSLTRRRLDALYGREFSLTLRNLEPRGFEVVLEIPLRMMPSAAHPDDQPAELPRAPREAKPAHA